MALRARYTTFGDEIVEESRGGVLRDFVPDQIGSTVALLDSSQAKTDTVDYWPLGQVSSESGPSTSSFRFVGTKGYYSDSESHCYVRARHYLGDYGMWSSVSRLWPDEEPYGYANSNPTSYIDPSGLFSVDSSCNSCPCKSSLDSIVKNICGSGGAGGIFGFTDSTWREIFACARARVPSQCTTPLFISWTSVRDCLKATCNSSKKIICSTCINCAYSKCDMSTPGNPSQPSDMVVCINWVCTASGTWNPRCNCTYFGGKCSGVRGREGTCTIIHEMAHACGFCSNHLCDQHWVDAIACCVGTRLR